MTDRPIIFSAPMVRALLEGRKTQTRRVLRDQPGPSYRYAMYDGFLGWSAYVGDPVTQSRFGLNVPYAPGDRLYVREAMHWSDVLRYSADDASVPLGAVPQGFIATRPHITSIHMPRWASRITLTVTEVRVQRLQEISAEDVQSEGACELAFVPPTEADTEEARGIFRNLWNSLHGPDAWDVNPWVVAISFTVDPRNIDSITPN